MTSQDRFKMATVVRLTGFTPSLLRAWERRHGVLDPDRGEGGHRLYTPDDLMILRYLKRMKEEGRSIGELARLGRETLLEEARRLPGVALSASESGVLGPAASERKEAASPAVDIGSIKKSIVDAAVRLDGGAIDHGLDQAFSLLSPPEVIQQVIEPCTVEIGVLWSRGLCTVASEHLATDYFMARVRSLVAAVRIRRAEAPNVLLACFPDERHELGILILGYHFSTLGWRITYLGAALPFEDFERALNEAAPRAAVLSVATSSVYAASRPRLLALLRRRPGGAAIFIGGQGAPSSDAEVEQAGGLLCTNGRPALARIEELTSHSAVTGRKG